MSTTTSLAIIVALLAANAFFVAAEFALVKAKGFRIENLADNGSASAKLTVRIMSNLEAYLAACQLGITMASLGLGWVGEPAVAHLLEPMFQRLGASEQVVHTASFIIGFLIFSSLHIVVGEQVPKTLAIRKPEPVSMWSAYPLHIAYLAVWPLNWALNKASNTILRWMGVAPAGHDDVLSGAELKGLVATSQEHGEIESDRAAMLHNLFEFDERQVGRVMIPRNSLTCLEVGDGNNNNLSAIKKSEFSRFPVIDSDDNETIIGILLVKDIHRALLNGVAEPWKNVKSYCRDALVVPESQKVPQLFELMRTRKVHMALIVDEYGTLVGAVTMEDLLEEIVGEIEDETDTIAALSEIRQTGDNSWTVDGLVSLGDVQKVVGLAVPPELDANSVSGLFMERLARMPEVDDLIVEDNCELTVRSVKDRRVGMVDIVRLDDNSASDGDPANRGSESDNENS